jgi:gliding motility-associated-like protein
MLVFLLAVWAVANAMAQGGSSVYEGDTKTYQVENHTGSSFSWVVYNEPTFTTLATSDEIRINSGENANYLNITWIKPGTYYPTVIETDDGGCSNTKSVAVEVLGRNTIWPAIRIANPTVMVGNMKYITTSSCRPVSIDASQSTGDGLRYHWEPSLFLDNQASSKPIFSSGTTTVYHLTLTDVYGHSVSDSIGILVAAAVKADAGDYVFIQPKNSVLLDGSGSVGDNLAFLWETKDGRILDGQTTAHPLVDAVGKYYLTVTDQYGCSDMDSVLVNYYTQAVKDTGSTKMNFSVDINVLANDIPRKDLDPASLRIVTPPQNGTAAVVADSVISYTPSQYFVGTDNFVYAVCDYFSHCDQASVLVIVNEQPFFIPQAFSPNGDGLNDTFEIKGLAKYKQVQITIFNRWGSVVYDSSNYGNGPGKDGFWDGKAKAGLKIGSGPVPTGTYFYVLKLDGKEKINGSLYLDR